MNSIKNMSSQKWSEKQDLKLRRAVEKYGTQWSYITKKFKFNRTLNSVVKRWHGKLKIQKVQNQPKNTSNAGKKTRSNQQKSNNNRSRLSRIKAHTSSSSRKDPRRKIKRISKSVVASQRNINNFRQSRSSKQVKDIQKQKLQVINKKVQNQMDQEDSQSSYIFQNEWKMYENNKLKELVLEDGILNWQTLAKLLKVQSIKEVRKRWTLQIYPKVKQQTKIGGCLMYSAQQDKILEHGFKKAVQTDKIKQFLPGRSEYSIDARRRRIAKGLGQNQIEQNKHLSNKLALRKIVLKMHKYYDKPKQEQDFMYMKE